MTIRERLKQLNEAQFEALLAGLEEEGYDLSYIRQQGVARTQTINDVLKLVQQSAAGLEQLENLLDSLFRLRPASSKPIPTLLPYLVDRKDQELKLGRAIQAHRNKSHPLLCLIHGHEEECGDMFLERLEKDSLPRLVPEQMQQGIKTVRFDCDVFHNIDELQEKMLASLGEQLCDNLLASLDDIIQGITQLRCPLILHTDMCSKDWQRGQGADLIHGFVKFWNDWPRLEIHRYLTLVCLSFNYQDLEETKGWLKRWFNRSEPSINEEIRLTFSQLAFDNFIVLPELQSVEKEQVESWAKMYANKVCDVNDLIREIRAYFENYPESKITMAKLAYELKRILPACCA